MTHPTKAIAPILLEDMRKVAVERKGETNFFTSQMIKDCMKKVVAVNLHQIIQVFKKYCRIFWSIRLTHSRPVVITIFTRDACPSVRSKASKSSETIFTASCVWVGIGDHLWWLLSCDLILIFYFPNINFKFSQHPGRWTVRDQGILRGSRSGRRHVSHPSR